MFKKKISFIFKIKVTLKLRINFKLRNFRKHPSLPEFNVELNRKNGKNYKIDSFFWLDLITANIPDHLDEVKDKIQIYLFDYNSDLIHFLFFMY